MLTLLIPIAIILSLYWIWNPYLGWTWRSNEELWRTRERSYGWPFYWKMQPGNDPEAKRAYYSCLTNPVCKTERLVGNVIYIE